ncbi:sporulation membrane protein YtaF [Clostridium cellulovorans]|uniref:Sporulation protein YtaF n=1 Tax=Clostridium cellulovorans (strain ATCC 35296 / DSM 3052 / OCM 3 / 743B) TaxID=573061 RepID=D9SS57_CLOC7|nr:sporulation membrane protein YtaF [Clostridium cellulovorans]ADL52504.1 sporulation protein YtaF [Clostridium cellulovorans 743B]
MQVVSSLLLAISASLDCFAVGVAYGIKKIRIGLLSNVIIALISAMGTFLSMSVGIALSNFMSINISKTIGALILIGIGIWFIGEFYFKDKGNEVKKKHDNKGNTNYKELLDDPYIADKDKSGYIDVKEAMTLAIALAINNIGLGLGASITGLNIILTTIITFFLSIITLIIGYYFGEGYLSKVFGKYAALISSVIILCLGIYQLFF